MATGERRNPILAADGYAMHIVQDNPSVLIVKSVGEKQVIRATSHQK